MRQLKRSKHIWQSLGMLTTVLALASGVAFAALQSQLGILKGNVIQTAIASLQVSPDGNNYANTMDGYVFGNLVPGGLPYPLSGYPVYVKNVGSAPLTLKFSINPGLDNPNNVDLSKVHVILTPIAGGAGQNMTMQELTAANSSGGLAITSGSHMNPNQVVSYFIKVSLDNDAVNGPGATLSNVDFNFNALATN